MIRIYSRPGCGQCAVTMKLLDRGGVPYEVIDLAADPWREEEVITLGCSELPVVVLPTGEHWSGLRYERVTALVSEVQGASL